MNEVQQYDIIKIIQTDSVQIIGSFHSMEDGEIIVFVPPTIQYIPTSSVTHISRIKRKDEYDTSKIEAFFTYSSFIHKRRYKIHDILLITFEDDSEVEAKITEIIDDCLTLQMETQEYLYINFKYKSIPLGILEIKRKQLHDLDDDLEEDKTYTVVSYNIDESKCRYTLEIQVNAILQYLNFIHLNGELYAQRYRELMLLYPYGEFKTPVQSNLKWIVPITNATTKLTNINTFKKSLEGSLMCYQKSLVTNKEISYDAVQNTYQSVLRVFDKKYPIGSMQSYLLPETIILQFEGITASKEKETNWAKKIQTWVSYLTDESLPIIGYTSLPHSSIYFSKYYLPETHLIKKILLNTLSQYHLFQIRCEPSFTFKKVDDYTTLIPSLDELIQSNKTPSYSLYEFIHALEPYHIYSNEILDSYIPKIQARINKHIKTFLTHDVLQSTPESSTILSVNENYKKIYISTSELYAYALSQDSANAFVVSQLTPPVKTDPLPKPSEPETAFIMKPPEPTCELKDDCDVKSGPDKIKNFDLSVYHSSTSTSANPLDISFLTKKIKYNTQQLLKYNNKLTQVHSLFESIDRLPPTYEMFYQIMAYPLTKRYTTLLQFITKYTTLDKSTQIFVCNTSNLPLIPMLFKLLADTYLKDVDEYNTFLYNYCRSSLSISIEDGYYKDKFTGLSLAPIERVQSFDEMVRSAELELDESAPLDFTPDQVYIETHVQTVWKELTNKPLLTRHTLLPFINDMSSTYSITTKTTKISPNYLLSLLIFVFIQFRIPCDKIVDELAKNKNINKLDLGFIGNTTPFSFLTNLQKYAPVISKLCTTLDAKYSKQVFIKPKKEQVERQDTFMPYYDSNHPVLITIKAQLQASIPIHIVNGEAKRNNQAFIDLKLPRHKRKFQDYECYIKKIDFPPRADIEFHFDLPNPMIIEMKTYPDIYQEYKTSEPLDDIKRQLVQLQTILQDLSSKTVNEIIDKYPPLYFANYIKTVTQFYANLSDDYRTNFLKLNAIPITQEHLIAPSHKETIDRVLNNYYKDFLYREKWGDLFLDSQPILEELNQPLNETTKIILIYYLYKICRNVPKDVVQFVDTKLKSELNIPDYSDIKKRMSVRQSVERQNFVRRSKNHSPIEKTLNSIIETEITKTSYNVAQFTSRIEDALKADAGDAGEKGDDGNDGEDGNDGGNDE